MPEDGVCGSRPVQEEGSGLHRPPELSFSFLHTVRPRQAAAGSTHPTPSPLWKKVITEGRGVDWDSTAQLVAFPEEGSCGFLCWPLRVALSPQQHPTGGVGQEK